MLFGLSLAVSVQAYSYAAAGKEPLIDGREAVLLALSNDDFKAVQTAINGLDKEFAYLKNEHHVDILTPMKVAINTKDRAKIEALMDKAVYEEVLRRLDGAKQNLSDYQVAKVLVVKSKLFLDLLTPKLDDEHRVEANQAIQGVLAAIGNPGVFGVGAAPAAPDVFEQQKERLTKSLSQFK